MDAASFYIYCEINAISSVDDISQKSSCTKKIIHDMSCERNEHHAAIFDDTAQRDYVILV